MQYRLHIDIPLGTDEEKAIHTSQHLMEWLFHDDRHQCMKMEMHGVSKVGYRLGFDEDRQKSNYLDKNENGHVSNKKITIDIKSTSL